MNISTDKENKLTAISVRKMVDDIFMTNSEKGLQTLHVDKFRSFDTNVNYSCPFDTIK